MNLYLLTQNENTGYDTHDSCVVCAESESDARTIHPYDTEHPTWDNWKNPDTWAKSPDSVTVECIGVATANRPRGVILASFNAG